MPIKLLSKILVSQALPIKMPLNMGWDLPKIYSKGLDGHYSFCLCEFSHPLALLE
ncbi:hypothetical protein lpl0213 [Legionella pneumophila str. Lens]|uniref:Uncharacterized protein n=1 Tax=Legionella pneumophila (strain Lens) TaxID=297245 RepID=Q5X016_LEGPL|nr:hypothetical protein lpl0213 [Legionella pneumophila str. Lens]